MKDTYDFPVELKEIKTSDSSGIAILGKRAVIRTDLNIPLGVVSDKYAVLEHKNVINGFRQALEGQDFKENISLQRDGAQLYATYTLKDVQAEVKKGDFVGMQFTARNSYDGSTQLRMSLGAIRLVCQNGMTITKNFIEYSQKHIGTDMKLDVMEVQAEIEKLTSQFKRIVPSMTAMADKVMTKPVELLFDKKSVNLPAYLLKEAQDEFNKAGGNTLWDYYNSLTFAVTHKLRKDTPGLEAYYSQAVWKLAEAELAGV